MVRKVAEFLLSLGLVAHGVSGGEQPVRPAADLTTQPSQENLEHQIQQWIEQLGSSEFALREQARRQLISLQTAAFDLLDAARSHPDIEVRLQATNLLRSIRIPWTSESEPAEIKQIFRDYQDLDLTERTSRVFRLAQLDTPDRLAPLCRIVRFDPDAELAKQAAILAMQDRPSGQDSWSDETVAAIQAILGTSQRTGARWLRAFLTLEHDPQAAFPVWRELIHEAASEAETRPERRRFAVTMQLLRWYTDVLLRANQTEEAMQAMHQTLAVQDDSLPALMESVDWLTDRSAWAVIEELAQRFADQFAQSPRLLYRHAEALLNQGENERAEGIAEQASRFEFDERIGDHLAAAYLLQSRGLFGWADRHYRRILEVSPDDSYAELETRFFLAEMKHDQGEDHDAGQLLEVLVQRMNDDLNVVRRVTELRGDPGSVHSRMHYFFAQHYAASGEVDKQRQHLEEAIRADEMDADVLIAMFRFPQADDTWRQSTRERIQKAAQHLDQLIQQLEQELRNRPEDDEQRYRRTSQLATYSNHYAWLIGNTEGDYQEALRRSQRSLELRPNQAGFLDTLARCYYALGDLENAVKFQQQATQLEPHSGQIRKQLELFTAALSQQKTQNSNERDAQEKQD